MTAVYVQRRSEGLDKISTYLTVEKVPFVFDYETKPKPWLSKIVVIGDLGEWNLRRVFDIVNENDLRIDYSNNRLQIFI